MTRSGTTGRLVLTLREGDRVAIGEPANPLGWVLCDLIDGGRVRLAFMFDTEIPVHRGVVVERILDRAGGQE